MAADIFSLGCIFFFILTKGSHPFGKGVFIPGNILKKQAQKENWKLDVKWQRIIEKMIDHDPNFRPSAVMIYREVLRINSAGASGRVCSNPSNTNTLYVNSASDSNSPIYEKNLAASLKKKAQQDFHHFDQTDKTFPQLMQQKKSGIFHKMKRFASRTLEHGVQKDVLKNKHMRYYNSSVKGEKMTFAQDEDKQELEREICAYYLEFVDAPSSSPMCEVPELPFEHMIEKYGKTAWEEIYGPILLSIAVANGNREALTYLIKAGIDINVAKNLEKMPIHRIHLATQNFKENVAAVFAHGAITKGKEETMLLGVGAQKMKGECILHSKKGSIDKNGRPILCLTVQGENPGCAKYLAEKSIVIYPSKEFGGLAIHGICYTTQNFKETLDALLYHGADINATRNDGATPLGLAAMQRRSVDDLQYIIDRGGDLHCNDDDGWSILHFAVYGGNAECVKYLVEKGINIHSPAYDGANPIHAICVTTQNFKETLDALLDKGADINATRNDGATPLGLAAMQGRSVDDLQYIVDRGGDLHCRENVGRSILHFAVRGGNPECVKYLVEKGINIHSPAYDGENPIHTLCVTTQNFKDTLDALLDNGADINATRNDGGTPLALAAMQGRSVDDLQYIVERGGELHCWDNDGWSILHFAVQGGNVGCVKYSVEKGINIHLPANDGANPIHTICFTTQNFKNTLDALLDNGADINATRNDGATPLGLAAREGRSVEELHYIVDRGGELHCRDNDGWSILHFAVRGGNPECVKYLVEKGINIHSPAYDGANPIHAIFVTTQNFKDTLDELLDNGADINATRNDGVTPLGLAAMKGRTLDDIKYIVDRGGDLHRRDNYGWSILHYAVQGGNLESVKYLVEKGINIHSPAYNGANPIHAICVTTQNFKETLDALLDIGAHINATRNDGTTPLALAAMQRRSVDDLQYIVDRGGELRCRNNNGRSILHFAVRGGNPECVKYLVEKGINIHSPAYDGANPIHAICVTTQNFKDTLDELLDNGADINATRNDGTTPLALAAMHGRSVDDLQYIVDRGGDLHCRDNDGWSILHFALQGENLESVKYLVEKGINIHSPAYNGANPIHTICFTTQNFKDTLAALLDNGADINATRNDGVTPLGLAAKKGRTLDDIKYIVDRGGDLHCRNNNGRSILHFAVRGGNPECVKYLVEKGINIHSPAYDGVNPIHAICVTTQNFKDTLDELLDNGAHINATRNDGATPLALAAMQGRSVDDLQYIVDRGGNLHCNDNDGKSILHIAVQGGNVDCVKYLVDNGINIHSPDYNGEHPIHKICFTTQKFKDTLDALLDNGADINATRNDGATPLGLAAREGRSVEELHYIVDRGGELHCRDNDGWSMLHFAVRGGNPECVKYLVEKGISIHSLGYDGEHPIHAMCFTTQNFKETLDALLDNGAHINATRNDGATPLVLSVFQGRATEELDYIIYRGGLLTFRNNYNWSILHLL